MTRAVYEAEMALLNAKEREITDRYTRSNQIVFIGDVLCCGSYKITVEEIEYGVYQSKVMNGYLGPVIGSNLDERALVHEMFQSFKVIRDGELLGSYDSKHSVFIYSDSDNRK